MAQAIVDPRALRRCAIDLDRFVRVSQDHSPFLLRQAEAAEEYLRRR